MRAVCVTCVLLPPLPYTLAAPIAGCKLNLAPAVALPGTKEHLGMRAFPIAVREGGKEDKRKSL